MRNLSDIIKEVLVHQHANKDTKRFEYGKEITSNVSNTNNKNYYEDIQSKINENDYICIEWKQRNDITKKNEVKKVFGVVANTTYFKIEKDSIGTFNLKIPVKLGFYTDNTIVISKNDKIKYIVLNNLYNDRCIRYCRENECKRIDIECKINKIKL